MVSAHFYLFKCFAVRIKNGPLHTRGRKLFILFSVLLISGSTFPLFIFLLYVLIFQSFNISLAYNQSWRHACHFCNVNTKTVRTARVPASQEDNFIAYFFVG
jgi:hypothetical protein